MPKGKHGLFAGPLPIQSLKQVLQNPQQSYNAVLSQWYHTHFPPSPTPVTLRSKQITQPHSKHEKHYSHL